MFFFALAPPLSLSAPLPFPGSLYGCSAFYPPYFCFFSLWLSFFFGRAGYSPRRRCSPECRVFSAVLVGFCNISGLLLTEFEHCGAASLCRVFLSVRSGTTCAPAASAVSSPGRAPGSGFALVCSPPHSPPRSRAVSYLTGFSANNAVGHL